VDLSKPSVVASHNLSLFANFPSSRTRNRSVLQWVLIPSSSARPGRPSAPSPSQIYALSRRRRLTLAMPPAIDRSASAVMDTPGPKYVQRFKCVIIGDVGVSLWQPGRLLLISNLRSLFPSSLLPFLPRMMRGESVSAIRCLIVACLQAWGSRAYCCNSRTGISSRSTTLPSALSSARALSMSTANPPNSRSGTRSVLIISRCQYSVIHLICGAFFHCFNLEIS
jgi:hypothetical protein